MLINMWIMLRNTCIVNQYIRASKYVSTTFVPVRITSKATYFVALLSIFSISLVQHRFNARARQMFVRTRNVNSLPNMIPSQNQCQDLFCLLDCCLVFKVRGYLACCGSNTNSKCLKFGSTIEISYETFVTKLFFLRFVSWDKYRVNPKYGWY